MSKTPQQIWEGLSDDGQRALLSPELSDSTYGYAEIGPDNLQLARTTQSWEGRHTELTLLGRAVAEHARAQP